MPGAASSLSAGDTRDGAFAGRGELIAKIGTIVSAIMASSCCWLPVVLLAVGVSGAGIATALEAYRPIFMFVTFGFLAMAFYFTYRPRRVSIAIADPNAPAAPADCCAPASTVGTRRFNMMTLNKVMLWCVTGLAVVFLFFPQYVTGLLDAGNEEITTEMTRSMVKIEGMTCEG